MARPSLKAGKCYCAEGEEFALYCYCDRCRRLPSLKLNKVDKDMSREEIKSVLTALNLGEIRQIEIIKVERLVVVVVYFVKWGYNHDMIRLRVKEGNTVKFTFQDAYDISQTWIVEKIEKEPRWFNYNWGKQLEVKVEFEAQHLDMTFPGSCTPRADKKTKEEVEIEIKKRDIYYFMKNIYQTYDVVKYEELIEIYGEGFMWDVSEYESESDFLDKFTSVEQCYKQTNWIPQINLHPSFKSAKKDYEVVALGLHERPIKDRVYEPEEREKYLNIIANTSKYEWEKTCNLKEIVIEELLARFWLCHKSEVLVNPENLVGCDLRTRNLVANRAQNLLLNKVISIDKEVQHAYYYCYFCNKKHIKPIAWDRWQTLYNTVPRCSCQYREITQERIREVRENPTKYVM